MGPSQPRHIYLSLGRLAQWASSNHPDEDLWHLLTDCFPAPGVTGLASLRGLCKSPGVVTRFEVSKPCSTCNVVLT